MSIETTFNAIYAEQHPRIVKWLHWKLPAHATHAAEDYAQEAFADLWAMLQKGKTVDYPWSLLKKIALRRMADYFANKSKVHAEAVMVDFAGEVLPESVIHVEAADRYASGEPELALLVAQLQTAMERMQEASKRWRDLHGLVSRNRHRADLYSDPAVVAKWQAELERTTEERDGALVELQEACRVVGNLRADLEREGGACWQSSCGWPPPPFRKGGQPQGSGATDPTVKECCNGHRLDDLENVNFSAEGVRTCRTCYSAATRRCRERATAVSA
ncbi:sigma-70 RNA polymerase sigma factor region 4 domain-containing protein [Streptomyces sp. SGAir0957]